MYIWLRGDISIYVCSMFTYVQVSNYTGFEILAI